jgi:hypothetical protein
MINPSFVDRIRQTSGVGTVDTRLVDVMGVMGFVKAHIATNETTGESFNNQIVPEMYTGSSQALIIGIDPGNSLGHWYTSDGFLSSNDANNTIVVGDSLVDNIVQMPYNLAQIYMLGSRYNVKGAIIDPLDSGNVLYMPVQSIQNALHVNGYNVLLVNYNQDPRVLAVLTQLANTNGLIVGYTESILNPDLALLNNTWSYLLILPFLTLALTGGILLSYLTTNFSRKFNDYIILKTLGAKTSYRFKLLFWESWGPLIISMIIAIPLAIIISYFFILPEATISIFNIVVAATLPVILLTIIAILSVSIYYRKLTIVTAKDLRL